MYKFKAKKLISFQTQCSKKFSFIFIFHTTNLGVSLIFNFKSSFITNNKLFLILLLANNATFIANVKSHFNGKRLFAFGFSYFEHGAI